MLNNSALATAEKILKTQYNAAIARVMETNPFVALGILAMTIESVGSEETYGWLGEMPIVQEWLGDLTVDDLGNFQYTIRNKHFYTAVGIHEDEIMDDRLGLVQPRIATAAVRAAEYIGRLIHDLLLNGTTYLAFDNIAFFSAATGARPNNNILTGTLSAGTPTQAQFLADVDAMRVAMLQFVDLKGEVIGAMMDTLVVHPSMERIARTAVASASDPSQANPAAINPFQTWIKNIVVDPLLTDKNDLYGLCLNYPVKPFVWQERSKPRQWMFQKEENLKCNFVTDFRGAAGLTFPFLAVKSVSAVA